MGRPFAIEIEELGRTYVAARNAESDQLALALASTLRTQTAIVGSGGSRTIAEILAFLHRHAGCLAASLTPMELIGQLKEQTDSSVWCVSAGGGNTDILAAFEYSAISEVERLYGLTARRDSRLARLCEARYPWSTVFDLPYSERRDGFLATNSLLALSVPILQSFAGILGVEEALPVSVDDLHPRGLLGFREEVRDSISSLGRPASLLLLHGPQTAAAAIDIESKLVEAGLAAVMVADYRNFAHGRHNWLDKNPDTAVVRLSSDEDERIDRATSQLIPTSISSVSIPVPGNLWTVQALGIVASIFVTEAFGEMRGIDPGRPGVRDWGRKVYSVPELRKRVGSRARATGWKQAALGRKHAARPLDEMGETGQARDRFVEKLLDARIAGVVLDYDGTIVQTAKRLGSVPPEIAGILETLISTGLHVGIATGRGKSAREALRDCLAKRYWPHVVVGYYNGSQLHNLDSRELPAVDSGDSCLTSALELLGDALPHSLALSMELRPDQLTIEAPVSLGSGIADQVRSLLAGRAETGSLTVVESGHSVDVLTERADKRRVADAVRDMSGQSDGLVLAIGDRGEYGGNDFQLLTRPFSLSVDRVSSSLESCWNLLPAGCRGPSGTLLYLKALRRAANSAHFRMSVGEWQ